VFAIPASLVASALIECGEKKVVEANPDSVGLCRGPANVKGQEEIQAIGQKYGIRLMGPNIYGFYYTPANLVRDVLHRLRRQGLPRPCRRNPAAIGHGDHSAFRARPKMGVSAIVGLGNKSDIDEDDLLDVSSSRTNNNPDHLAQQLRGT